MVDICIERLLQEGVLTREVKWWCVQFSGEQIMWNAPPPADLRDGVLLLAAVEGKVRAALLLGLAGKWEHEAEAIKAELRSLLGDDLDEFRRELIVSQVLRRIASQDILIRESVGY